MSAKYRSPSFLLPNELNTSANTANDTGINSLYSMDFSSTDYISTVVSELNSSTSFSISFWGKLNSTSSNLVLGDLVPWNGASFRWTYIGVLGGEGIQFLTTNGSNNYLWGLLSKDTDWHHFVVTYNSGTRFIYVDGSQLATNTTGPASLPSTFGNAFKIGQDNSGGSNVTNGQIDEVAIFNRALNTTEIAALYGGTSPNIYPSNLMAADLNPIAYYPLGEQAQNTGYLTQEITNGWQFPNGVLQDYVMDFDSTSPGDYISTPMTMLNSATQCTISFWGKKDASNKKLSVGGTINNSEGIWILWYNDGNIYFSPRGASAGSFSLIYAQPYDNNWHHYLGVYDGSSAANCKLYLDGNLVATGSGTLPSSLPATTGDNFQIGALTATNHYSDGQISNVAVWNTAITDANQIADIYNNGSPQTSYTVSPQNWWKLNATSVYTPSVASYSTALDFGGTDYIDCGVVSAVENASSFSMSVWVYPTNGSIKSVIGNWGNPYVGVEIGTSSGAVYFTVDSDTGGSGYGATPSGLSNSNWAHLVLVFDGSGSGDSGRLKGYINGVEQTLSYTGTIPATTAAPNRAFRIGDQHVGNGLIGNISNAAIFNSALTSTQVSTLFNFGTPETAISFSPTSWWKLDNLTTGLLDSGSASNNGTNNGTTQVSSSVAVVPSWKIPTALTIPTINYTTALDFPGSSDYIDYGNPSNLNIGENITASAWFKNNGTAGQVIISKGVYTGETGSGFPYEIQVRSNGGIAWQYYGTNTQGSTSGRRVYILSPTTGASAVDYRDNTWHHVVGTKNGVNSKLYIDGVLITDFSAGGSERDYMVTNTSPVRIGASSSGASGFIGEISNVAIWDSALTDGGVSLGSVAGGQIAGLYNSGQPETSMSYSPLSWWKLDDVTTGIQDSGSASNNGTIVGQVTQVTSDVTSPGFNIPVNGVSTTLPSTALQQSDLQFDSPYSNYSLSFDGTGDYINCTDNDMFSFGNGTTDSPFSISTWVNMTTVTNFVPIAKDSSGAREWTIRMVSGQVHFYIIDNSVADGYIGRKNSSSPSANTWFNLVCTYDGSASASGIRIYLDGVRVDDADYIGTGTYVAMENTSAIVSIAMQQNGSVSQPGNIDETAIFNTELTSAQILEIYNNGRPKDLSTFSGTAPTSWWRLGENAYFDNNLFIVPNSISGAPNGIGAGTINTMISADAPGTYANGIGTNLDIIDRVGDAALSTSNSQSYNMIPSDISPYVPQYVGKQIANNFSMTFDGANDYIDTGHTFSGDKWSYSYWVNISDPGNNSYFYHVTARNSSTQGLIIFSGNGSVSSQRNFTVKMNSTTITFSVASFATWYNIVITGDGSNLTAYVDGTQVATTAISTLFPTINYTTKIGSNKDGSLYFFNGQIDEVAIFDTALNAGQIYNDIYQPTSTGTNQTADFVNNPNLPNPVAWYRMGD